MHVERWSVSPLENGHVNLSLSHQTACGTNLVGSSKAPLCYPGGTYGMKSLEVYGTSLVKYEGAAYLAFPEESGIVYNGYFEAKQLTSGAIAIGFVPIAQESDGSKTGPVYSEPSFHGRDPDGWDISTCGQTGVSPILGLLGAPESAIYPAHVFRPEGIRARRDGATESGYSKVQFLVSNLLWHDRNVVPEPITLEIGELTLTVAPIGDYLEVAGSIMAVRGIAPTAQVLIKASDASNRSLQHFGDLMDRPGVCFSPSNRKRS